MSAEFRGTNRYVAWLAEQTGRLFLLGSAYSGLAIVMRSSSDWVKTPHGWQRAETVRTRGLNRNYNRRLKNIFKGAATTVITQRLGPMVGDYQRGLEQGTKLTLARRISATVLAMWKNKEAYHPERYRPTP